MGGAEGLGLLVEEAIWFRWWGFNVQEPKLIY
jgi:hypothetical protein